MARGGKGIEIDRRTLLVGGGAGVGLLVAWALWPRDYAPNLRAAPGEHVFNAFLKVGNDGRVIVAVPQAELGQGVYTSLPQILADELGADWRTVGVEAAPIGPLYANPLYADQSGLIPGWAEATGAEAYARRNLLMLTGGSTSVRAFEPRLRAAGAAARALLMKAAARRWDADWEGLETGQGFVLNGAERLSFAELAEAAAEEELPDELLYRGGAENRLVGQPLPRIDIPAKIDGSAQFAGDVRLPDMVYASVRQGPHGEGRLIEIDRAAAERITGVLAVFETPLWAAAVATNWWAANRAVEAMKPLFETRERLASSATIDAALAEAMAGDSERILERGDIDAALQGPNAFRAYYSAAPAASAAPETLTATARLTGDRLEIWAPTQAPTLARAAAARGAGVAESQVALYPMLAGGGYGRKFESAAIEQAAALAARMKRPVQLVWSRIEETMQDGFRPPARATLSARLGDNGTIAGWRAEIAAPEVALAGSPVAGAEPPYAIPAMAIDHHPVEVGIRTGVTRGRAYGFSTFCTESFIDELARKFGLDPLSFRIQMLGENPRLARALTSAAALGGWDGGAPGSAMGIAAASAFGSHIATLVEIEVGETRRLRVLRAVAAVDCGRVINPAIVRQLIEGGIVHAIGDATAYPVRFDGGLPSVRRLGDIGLPRLADSPEVTVEIVPSEEEPGGVTELGLPTVAPAIANALFALTGQRLRRLPLVPGARP